MPTVEIYTRDYCGYCGRATQLLRGKGVAFREYNATREPARRDEMIRRSGRTTFPQIFIGDLHVGGSDELSAFERSGKLDKALEGTPAR
ncbi:glutaredoxin 3 [Acuticoccus sp. MNP-M23]|uniref:glutaredoxin 3 n=1 Tax=Acuticoccus sp. MNP-M23 TaxID=3072793 RepID=UPI0028151B32|nr:glutaredoxin 3 [Acuticoccus sp. MNP-M23]WMS42847.1 glutaredoxin 3 [Acuticoccus sp. MNP-M23]